MLAVSCQMASFRGSWRNQIVTKTKPRILAQPNTCVGSQSAGSPTSASATGIMKSPATNSAIKYVTSKIAASQNAIMAGCLAFSCIVLPEPCGSSSDLSSRRQRRQVVVDGSFASPNNFGEQCSSQHLRPRRVVRTLALSRPSVLPSAGSTASAPSTFCLSRLDSWPMHSPADASTLLAHGSGPMWFGSSVSRSHPPFSRAPTR
jgi:hypothetical protein